MPGLRLSLAVFLCSITLVAQGVYVPQRVFATARHAFTDFETMLADIARADVVLIGEQHDDADGHRLELLMLEGLARRRTGIVLGLEMFERDAQDPLDHFQMGHIEESEFLAASRPWPDYQKNYEPLVDFAIEQHWPVFASNVPRAIAADVAKDGLGVLAKRPANETAWFAADINCPTHGPEFSRFADAMTDHSDAGAPGSGAAKNMSTPDLARYYEAQCLKDETMAESIARAYTIGAVGGEHPLVAHVNGAFHSDFGDGITSRVRRRLTRQRVVVVALESVADIDTVSPGKTERRRADYLVYSVAVKDKK